MPPAAPLTLCSARCGQRLRVLALKPECPHSNQLREMGFREKCELLKLSDGSCILCTLAGVRLAIARALGSAILVEPVAA
jgi:Fe2+ transport system protein FeoA